MSTTKYIYQKITSRFFVPNKDNPFSESTEILSPLKNFKIIRSISASESKDAFENILSSNSDNEYPKIKSYFLFKKIFFNLEEDYNRNNFIYEEHEKYIDFLQSSNQLLHLKGILLSSFDYIDKISSKSDDDEYVKDYEQWVNHNTENIVKFLNLLSNIYENRTTPAKLKDFVFQAIDVIIFSMVMIGISFVLLKAAPLVVSWWAITEGAKISILIGSGAVSCLGAIFYKIFNNEHNEIKNTIYSDARRGFTNR